MAFETLRAALEAVAAERSGRRRGPSQPAQARSDATDGTEVPWATNERVVFPARIIQTPTEEAPC